MAIKIVLGSKSELKRQAVMHALQVANVDAEVVCVDAPSGVNPQPVGLEEMKKGALNRALAARDAEPSAYALGIENGLLDQSHSGTHARIELWADMASIVLISPISAGDDVWTQTPTVNVHSKVVDEVFRRQFMVTVGQILAEKYGSAPEDPHSFLTDGKWSRQKLLTKDLAQLFLDELPRPNAHRVRIGSVTRHLPIREVAPDVRVALFSLLGDWQLAEEAGIALVKRVPEGIDALLMPDGKAQALLHVMGRASKLPTFVARKERKPYMGDPVVSVSLKSITTDRMQELFLGAEDVARLAGRSVAFVDDVVSTGGTLKALEALVEKVGARHAATLAIFTEGKPREDVISLGHLPLF